MAEEENNPELNFSLPEIALPHIEDEAWQAVVTGIALDMAFAKSRNSTQIEH